MDNDYVLQKDVKVAGHRYRYRIASFKKQGEDDDLWFYTVVGEIHKDETVEPIYGRQFKTLEEAEKYIKDFMAILNGIGKRVFK